MSFKSFLFPADEVLICKTSRQCCKTQNNILSSRIIMEMVCSIRICLRNESRTPMNLWKILAAGASNFKKIKGRKEKNEANRDFCSNQGLCIQWSYIFRQKYLVKRSLEGTQECEFFGSDFEFFTILLLIMLIYLDFWEKIV
jgi:hypothetical protein